MAVKHRGARSRKRRGGHAHRGERAKRKAAEAGRKKEAEMREYEANYRRRLRNW